MTHMNKIFFIGIVFLLSLTIIGARLQTQEYLETRSIFNEVESFLDKATDIREVSKQLIDDFSIAINSYSMVVDAVITRHKRVVNPSLVAGQKYSVQYVPMPILEPTKLETGDILVVEVRQRDSSFFRDLKEVLLRTKGSKRLEFKLSKKVR